MSKDPSRAQLCSRIPERALGWTQESFWTWGTWEVSILLCPPAAPWLSAGILEGQEVGSQPLAPLVSSSLCLTQTSRMGWQAHPSTHGFAVLLWMLVPARTPKD